MDYKEAFTLDQREKIKKMYKFSYTWGFSIPAGYHKILSRFHNFVLDIDYRLREEKDKSSLDMEIYEKKLLEDLKCEEDKERARKNVDHFISGMMESFGKIIRKEIEDEYKERLETEGLVEQEQKEWRKSRYKELSQLRREVY